MSATIKIEQEKKEKLDRFLASLLLREGIKITLQEALGLIIDYALQNEEQIIQKLKELPTTGRRSSMESHRKPNQLGNKRLLKENR